MSTVILTKDKESGLKLRERLAGICDIFKSVPCLIKDDIERNPEKAAEISDIFSTWYMPIFAKEEIAAYFPSLKAIYYVAGTVDYFAEPFLASNVRVFSAASANGHSVAEFVVAQIILANKGYFQAQKAYHWPVFRRGYRNARKDAESHYGNYGATIGIIGCGHVGSKIVELLRPFKFNIVVYDPYISEKQVAELGIRRVGLGELFTVSDVITNHLPDNQETRGMLGYDLFSRMKKYATFINTGRGGQVSERDLSKALRKNPTITALLDVTTHEPLFPWSPLFWNKNVFMTPHIAGSLSSENMRMAESMVKAYSDNLQGISSVCEITLDKLNTRT